jgi:cytochrome c553
MLIAATVVGQDARVAQGERVFAANCSVPYCHGAKGTAGRAPKLVGHTFAPRDLANIVSNGIANKGMPSFRGQLSSDDLDAVIAYLMTLRDSSSAASATPVRTVGPDAPGKALFFDAVRLGGCGRCHELENRGSPVVESIKNTPADLRTVNAAHTVTVSAKGENAFPGLVLEQSEKRVRVYDLSSPLPVLRIFERGGAEVAKGSSWNHRDAVSAYSDDELRIIAEYLQTTIRK